MNFELRGFFLVAKNIHLKALLYRPNSKRGVLRWSTCVLVCFSWLLELVCCKKWQKKFMTSYWFGE